MMCNELLNNYISWLNSNFEVTFRNGMCIFVTPYLDPDGDCIEVAAIPKDEYLLLSDLGAAYDYLYLNGFNLTNKRLESINVIANKNGLKYNDGELVTIVKSADNFGEALFRLIRGITEMQYLINTAQTISFQLFKLNVAQEFDKHGFTYLSNQRLQGKAKNQVFDFALQAKSEYASPLLIQTLSTSNSGYAKYLSERVAFSFIDIREAKHSFTSAALLDDSEDKIWSGEPLQTLNNYVEYVIPWSKKEKILKMIAS